MVIPMSDLSPSAAEAPGFPIDPADLIAGLGRGLAVIESFDDVKAALEPKPAKKAA